LCAVFNLVVAWSYSGWLAAVIGIAILASARFKWRAVVVILGLTALGVGLGYGLRGGGTIPLIGAELADKQISAESRLSLGAHFVAPTEPYEWIVGADRPPTPENFFGLWFAATGLIGVALITSWIVLSMWALAHPLGDPLTAHSQWLVAAFIAVLVSSLFVPHLLVFPIGPLLFLVLAIGSSCVSGGRG
jgi:hypothetical protein